MTSSNPNTGWEYIAAVIAVLALVALWLLYKFYGGLQNSDFLSHLLGMPSTKASRPARGRRRAGTPQGGAGPPESPPSNPRMPSAADFRFAEEFLARRTEFWLLYAQFIVAVLFVATISGLMFAGVVRVDSGLPALSTVVGLVLGKTLLTSKGTPMVGQQQVVAGGPVNTAPPTVGPGDPPPTPPTTLTADPGQWSGQRPIAFAYQWLRKTAGGEARIAGQTSATYDVSADDAGHAVLVEVTASNAAGAASARSSPLPVQQPSGNEGGATPSENLPDEE